MMQLIIGIILILIVLGILIKLFGILKKLILISISLLVIAFAGPPLAVGYGLDKAIKPISGKNIFAYVFLLAAVVNTYIYCIIFPQSLPSYWSFEASRSILHQLKYLVPLTFAAYMLYAHNQQRNNLRLKLEIKDLFQSYESSFYICYFSSIAAMFISQTSIFFSQWTHVSSSLLSWLYWGLAAGIQLYATAKDRDIQTLDKEVCQELTQFEKRQFQAVLHLLCQKVTVLDRENVRFFFESVLAYRIECKELVEMELDQQRWILQQSWYDTQLSSLKKLTQETIRHTPQALQQHCEENTGFTLPQVEDFLLQVLSAEGGYRDFKDGNYFVSFHHACHIKVCASCGLTQESSMEVSGEWYCSDICRETEQACLTIKDKPWEVFLKEATSNGIVLLGSVQAWSKNQKVVATGGQGQGFAAEIGNTMIDRLQGKNAKVVGDNNAKYGADRLVNGLEIQTKYHSTGARSVGAMFDGQGGAYKYFDNTGKPMVVEVPKDQYANALQTMERKIEQGKVPGVSDPKQASELVRAGSLTYDQAKNITKFGTFESITYDIAQGIVVSSVAGGINFCLTAFLYYLNTKDKNQALRIAIISSGKTFAKTMSIFVTAQQLHRLAGVQNLLMHIDVSSTSASVRNVLGKGLGTRSTGGINKALRGTIVTSVAVVAVTTGPDLVKLVRGRISGAQLVKNLAVTTSSVTGGVIGSMAGAAALSFAGPVGIFAGKAAGGVLGGFVAAAFADGISKRFMEEDRAKIMRIVENQLAYLATIFILTKEEIDNLNQNLPNMLKNKTLEIIYSSKGNQKAMANFFLKPAVVSVVKQRPHHFDINTPEIMVASEQLAPQ